MKGGLNDTDSKVKENPGRDDSTGDPGNQTPPPRSAVSFASISVQAAADVSSHLLACFSLLALPLQINSRATRHKRPDAVHVSLACSTRVCSIRPEGRTARPVWLCSPSHLRLMPRLWFLAETQHGQTNRFAGRSALTWRVYIVEWLC